MAEYREGQRLLGSDGQIYVVKGGVPTPEGGSTDVSALVAPSPVRLARESQEQARREASDARAAAAAERGANADERAAEAADRTNANSGISNSMKLAGDYNGDPTVKAYRVAISQLGQALNTGAGPQADLALTYAFAKAMDPESVVRESEQGMVTASQPWFQAIVEKTKKQFNMDGAGNFTPEARDALREQIASAVAQRQRVYDARREYFKKQAQTFGVDPEIIIGEHDKTPFLADMDVFYKRVEAAKAPKDAQEASAAAGVPLDVTVTDDGSYADSPVAQSLSGINEGIANLVGAPVDVTTAAINAGTRGINALANTDIPSIQNPVAGSRFWADLMTRFGSITPETNDPTEQFMRRVGQSVGGSLIPTGSLPKLAAGVLTGLGGGIGGATAQQVAPGNTLAEMAAEAAGGGLTGFGALRVAQRGAQGQIESAIPTVDDLKQQAGDMYRAAEARGVTAEPTQTQQLAEVLRQALRDEGLVSPTGRLSEVYPKAKEALQLADDYSGNLMTPTQLQTVRKVVTDTGNSPDATERRLGSILTDAFDDWAAPIAPELPAARDVASRYLNAEKLETARELAGARAGQFTGSGFENALRTEYRALDRSAIKGRDRFAPELNQAIENVSRGTPGSNVARAIGRFAPTGPVSAATTMGVPAAIGAQVAGGPAGVALGIGTGLLGGLGRAAATNMGIRNADVAELIARNGGPIDQAPLVPEAFEGYASLLAAIQQAKYLSERPEQNPR